MAMDAETVLVGVVGHPVAHSLSPAFWDAALRHAQRNAAFLAFDVRPEDFEVFVGGMRAAGARGFNVTIPHKTAAFGLADRRSEVAEATGAVNVLVFGDETTGHNTDVHGVTEAVRDLGLDLGGRRVLVLGAGGAGRAAVYALQRGRAEVSVANRTPVRAEALDVPVVEWSSVGEVLGGFDLLVHTTSVGIDGRTSLLDESALREGGKGRLVAVLDVVYAPNETPLVHAARAAGLYASDGLRMLVHQAGQAWRLFFGDEAPLDVMHAAAAHAAGRPA